MKGFFKAEEIKSDINPRNPQSCVSCGLYKNCKTPKMKPYGKFKKEVMVIGEFPTDIDDRRGIPFQGRYGKVFQRTLQELGFNLFRDAICINAVNCSIDDNASTVSPNQIYCCKKLVFKHIKHYKPKLIILLGNLSIQSVIGNFWKKGLDGIDKWRGWQIPDQNLKTWLSPVYSPSFVLGKEEKLKNDLPSLIWKRDLFNALECLNKEFPVYESMDKGITYIDSNKQLISAIPRMIEADLLSFDYETTGLKPHHPDQEIISVSAAVSDTECYAWMNTPQRAKLWKRVLKSKVPKTAHNIPFEDQWSTVKLKTKVNNWEICTMNMAHCLDNRRKITSLKFQTYVNFGIADYDSHVSPYLKSDNDLGANSLNRIKEFIKEYGEKEILKYNGLDSIFGWMLAKKQQGVLDVFYPTKEGR